MTHSLAGHRPKPKLGPDVDAKNKYIFKSWELGKQFVNSLSQKAFTAPEKWLTTPQLQQLMLESWKSCVTGAGAGASEQEVTYLSLSSCLVLRCAERCHCGYCDVYRSSGGGCGLGHLPHPPDPPAGGQAGRDS